MIEICKYRGLEKVYALTLPNNHKAIRLLKKRGFMVQYGTDEAKATLNLKN
jgi:RimJ/RimL family protein N-acetyltransferase